jgi:hypothetical protein
VAHLTRVVNQQQETLALLTQALLKGSSSGTALGGQAVHLKSS